MSIQSSSPGKASKKEETKTETIYPKIVDNKSKNNQIIIPNDNRKSKSLKKISFNDILLNNFEKTEKSPRVMSKSSDKYYKIQKMMEEKLKNLSDQKKIAINILNKNKSKAKPKKNEKIIIDSNKNKDSTKEMKDILFKLIKLKKKINEINLMKKKKINLLNVNHSKQKPAAAIKKPTDVKIKIIKNNPSIKLRNYTNSIVGKKSHHNYNKYKTEEDRKNKTESFFNFNNINRTANKIVKTTNKDNNNNSYRNKTETNFKQNKTAGTGTGRRRNSLVYKSIVVDHTNYIDKIRDSEFISLFKKFKKSMRKNKKEEIAHKKSLVFPSELVNYIIKMKKELIIDKYRNEYLNKMDTYKYNTQKILKAIKYHREHMMNNLHTVNSAKKTERNFNSEKFQSKKDIKIKLELKMNDMNNVIKNTNIHSNNDNFYKIFN